MTKDEKLLIAKRRLREVEDGIKIAAYLYEVEGRADKAKLALGKAFGRLFDDPILAPVVRGKSKACVDNIGWLATLELARKTGEAMGIKREDM